MPEPAGRPIDILMVEDDADDVYLTEQTLKGAKVLNRLRVVADGLEALAYLRRQGPYSGAERPDLILLDLNLPRMSGRELLAVLKADPDLRQIPVVVLTTADSEEDVLKSYALNAIGYLQKPVDLQRFVQVVRSIEDFWVAILRVPASPSSSSPA